MYCNDLFQKLCFIEFTRKKQELSALLPFLSKNTFLRRMHTDRERLEIFWDSKRQIFKNKIKIRLQIEFSKIFSKYVNASSFFFYSSSLLELSFGFRLPGLTVVWVVAFVLQRYFQFAQQESHLRQKARLYCTDTTWPYLRWHSVDP